MHLHFTGYTEKICPTLRNVQSSKFKHHQIILLSLKYLEISCCLGSICHLFKLWDLPASQGIHLGQCDKAHTGTNAWSGQTTKSFSQENQSHQITSSNKATPILVAQVAVKELKIVQLRCFEVSGVSSSKNLFLPRSWACGRNVCFNLAGRATWMNRIFSVTSTVVPNSVPQVPMVRVLQK